MANASRSRDFLGSDMPNDTSPDIEALMIERYREMTPQQKLERVSDMICAVRELAMADVRRRYPRASERELKLRVASRWLDPDLMVRAFGWDPRVEGY